MPQQRRAGLSLAEWLVLCLVSKGPTHGFAIAGLLAHDGSVGRVWHVPRQVVYRAVLATLRFLDAALATVPAQRSGTARG